VNAGTTQAWILFGLFDVCAFHNAAAAAAAAAVDDDDDDDVGEHIIYSTVVALLVCRSPSLVHAVKMAMWMNIPFIMQVRTWIPHYMNMP